MAQFYRMNQEVVYVLSECTLLSLVEDWESDNTYEEWGEWEVVEVTTSPSVARDWEAGRGRKSEVFVLNQPVAPLVRV